MLMVILISSIGPITHADAIDYHVGHPYKAVFLKIFEKRRFSFFLMDGIY